jgi:hypothetical protein
VCNAQGICGCADGVTCNGQCGAASSQCPSTGSSGCSPKGSIPDNNCQCCICPLGTAYDPSNNSCDQNCTAPCTTWDATSSSCVKACTNVPNTTCNPNLPVSCECECNTGTYYDPASNGGNGGCVACPACMTTPTSGGNGNTCPTGGSGPSACSVPVTCPPNTGLYCNSTPNTPGYGTCVCPSPAVCWNGTKCEPFREWHMQLYSDNALWQ